MTDIERELMVAHGLCQMCVHGDDPEGRMPCKWYGHTAIDRLVAVALRKALELLETQKGQG